MSRRLPPATPSKTFYFEFHDGEKIDEDRDGTKFDSTDAAIIEAVSALTDIARDIIPGDGASRDLAFEIKDDTHRSLFVVEIHFRIKRMP